jgi:hypothetical protein
MALLLSLPSSPNPLVQAAFCVALSHVAQEALPPTVPVTDASGRRRLLHELRRTPEWHEGARRALEAEGVACTRSLLRLLLRAPDPRARVAAVDGLEWLVAATTTSYRGGSSGGGGGGDSPLPDAAELALRGLLDGANEDDEWSAEARLLGLRAVLLGGLTASRSAASPPAVDAPPVLMSASEAILRLLPTTLPPTEGEGEEEEARRGGSTSHAVPPAAVREASLHALDAVLHAASVSSAAAVPLKTCVPFLVRGLDDVSPQVRLAACVALRSLVSLFPGLVVSPDTFPTLLPRLAFSRYYGPNDRQRMYCVDTWRMVVSHIQEEEADGKGKRGAKGTERGDEEGRAGGAVASSPAPLSPASAALVLGDSAAARGGAEDEVYPAPAQASSPSSPSPPSPSQARSPPSARSASPLARALSRAVTPPPSSRGVVGVGFGAASHSGGGRRPSPSSPSSSPPSQSSSPVQLSTAAAAALAPGADGTSAAGPAAVAAHIVPIVRYYARNLSSADQALRECACHCVAELAAKVDPGAVGPHAEELLALLVRATEETGGAHDGAGSWCVRDAAVVALGKLLVTFQASALRPESRAAAVHCFLRLLTDPVRGVRDHAAMVIGLFLAASAVETTTAAATATAAAAAVVPAVEEDAGRLGTVAAQHHVASTKTTALVAVAASLLRGAAPASLEAAVVGLSGVGGVGVAAPPAGPASAPATLGALIEGGVFLLRELCAACPDEAEPLLDVLAEAAAESYVSAPDAHEALWRVLPSCAHALGARRVKRRLDPLLPPLALCIAAGGGGPVSSPLLSSSSFEERQARAGDARARVWAALDCAKALAALIGPSIFKARAAAALSGAHAAALLGAVGGGGGR